MLGQVLMRQKGSANPQPHIHLISVCLNNLDGLVDTVRSIDSQDYFNWTHHIQDGGSVDGTQDWVREVESHRRFLVAATDTGIYDAMNQASSMVQGDLVWLLNSGDTLSDPSVLRRVAEHYERFRWSWAYGGLNWVDKSGSSRVRNAAAISSWKVLFGLDAYPHPACVFSRPIFLDVVPFDTRLHLAADQDLCLRAREISEPALMPFTVVDFAPGGVSSRIPIRMLEREMHNLRGVRSSYILGSSYVDSVIQVLLGAARWVRRRVRR